ncbi:SpoIIIAH-like family protein [Schinkia azotoformans]|uniref:SpoIIIAH-like family protein n=1 Tax=Schinkia azotoformans TaxID=1454 RepID=UPI002DBF1E6A|nr:SpoIIIAH-like family protein [Schinkia azotoformans]MEC1719455.1 SpoIIIAH-like family protein [Schinkia azotoformans]MED4415593.1 SpoIIIAH-like family protein [Schinkia azotoformans]
MLLKKQTVWLLTMVSLVVVLSVFYITSPLQPSDEYALMPSEEKAKDQTKASEEGVEVSIEEMADGTVASSLSSDDLFTALRMEIDDNRAKAKEELQAIVASSDVTAEKRSEALDKMENLQTFQAKEAILETMILANENYADALVKAEENQVKVIVKAKELNSSSANEIMRLVRDELGPTKVAVEVQPIK